MTSGSRFSTKRRSRAMSARTQPADSASQKVPFIVRYRVILSWIPALLFLAAVILTRRENHDLLHDIMEQVGFALICLATLGRIWCGIYIAGRKNRELCQDGPYSICRNPLYLFSFFGVVGVALGAGAPWVALTAGVLFCVYYTLVIRSEETHL